MRHRTMSPQSRRSFLMKLACAGLAGAGFVMPASAQAQGFPRAFSSFSVDVGPLEAKGLGGPYADLVAQVALDELRLSFADRIDPRGPRLVLVVTGVFLTSSPGGGRGWRSRGDGGGGSDGMDGEALAVGPRGELLARFPQHAALEADRSIREPDELGRTAAIARHYVRWLRRRL